MTPAYDITTEQDELVIRVRSSEVDQQALRRLLDFLDLEAIRSRSVLEESQVEELASDVKKAAWQRVRHLFGSREQGD